MEKSSFDLDDPEPVTDTMEEEDEEDEEDEDDEQDQLEQLKLLEQMEKEVRNKKGNSLDLDDPAPVTDAIENEQEEMDDQKQLEELKALEEMEQQKSNEENEEQEDGEEQEGEEELDEEEHLELLEQMEQMEQEEERSSNPAQPSSLPQIQATLGPPQEVSGAVLEESEPGVVEQEVVGKVGRRSSRRLLERWQRFGDYGLTAESREERVRRRLGLPLVERSERLWGKEERRGLLQGLRR